MDPLLVRDITSTYQMTQGTINNLILNVVTPTPTPRAFRAGTVDFSQEHIILLHLTLKFSLKQVHYC